MTEAADSEVYRGFPGAFPYAFRVSSSLLFKLYVVVGTLLAAAIGLLFTLALIVLIANTAGTAGASGTLSLSRSFFFVVGLLVVLPIVAPILFVARTHRLGGGADGRYERRLAIAGFAFLLSIYLGLVISVPPEQRESVDGVLAPVVGLLYDLPAIVALLPPLVGAALIYVVHRLPR